MGTGTEVELFVSAGVSWAESRRHIAEILPDWVTKQRFTETNSNR